MRHRIWTVWLGDSNPAVPARLLPFSPPPMFSHGGNYYVFLISPDPSPKGVKTGVPFLAHRRRPRKATGVLLLCSPASWAGFYETSNSTVSLLIRQLTHQPEIRMQSCNGTSGENRTPDPQIKSLLLCRLSYGRVSVFALFFGPDSFGASQKGVACLAVGPGAGIKPA